MKQLYFLFMSIIGITMLSRESKIANWLVLINYFQGTLRKEYFGTTELSHL